jgi:diguanylate cyclase (GGDEF)-like protein
MTTDPKDLTGGEPGPVRVLLADDSRLVRTIVAGYLRAAGHEVEEAEDGAEALSRFEDGSFDVVVTDLEMPNVGGFGVLEAVKARSLGAEVVILTGSHAPVMSCAVRALRLGAHDFLTKPPSGPDEVVLTVERAAEKKRLRETNARLLRELERQTRTDALTGAQNRRSFDEALRLEVERSRRYGHPLSLALLDLDHFKSINDRYGHPAGDAVLKRFVAVAQGALRSSDVLYRYGGEEFAALLAHTPLDGALVAARRVVKATAATAFVADGITLPVTVSSGIAALSAEQPEAAELLARADQALYRAKAEGRNRACGEAALLEPALSGQVRRG